MPNEKPRVLLDIDGVLGDFTASALKIGNKLVGTEFAVDDVVFWDFCDLPGWEPYEDAIWEEIKKPGFARNMVVYPGASEAVRHLKTIADVRIVTSSMGISEPFCFERLAWLDENFGIPWKKVVYAYEKSPYAGDFFVDDKVANVQGWLEENGTKATAAVLWTQPYNQAADIHHPKLHRFNDWDKLIKLVGAFVNRK